MNTITRRSPGLYDSGNWTLAIARDWRCDGSHRPYKIELIHRVYTPGAGAQMLDGTFHDGLSFRKRTLTVPLLRFATAFRHRWLMPLYRLQQKAAYALASI